MKITVNKPTVPAPKLVAVHLSGYSEDVLYQVVKGKVWMFGKHTCDGNNTEWESLEQILMAKDGSKPIYEGDVVTIQF